LAVLLMLAVGLHAQSPGHSTRVTDAKIDLKGTEFRAGVIVINYEIPYSGVVEIRLFNEVGQKIWQNQYADVFGPNKIVLKASKFNPGETYAYQLNYKQDELKGVLVIPPSGLE
jgi:hypothetical protein